MTNDTFKARAYVKEGCPFSFKFLLFMTEAGLLDRIEIIRMDPSDPSFEATKARLSEGLGKAATFPTVEVEPGVYQSDSDRLIERFAERHGVRPDDLPILSFYKQTIFPQLLELHRMETAGRRA
ncbi:MAG TPA: hypothetical protein VF322_05815 [Gammaproteobacteria bacterium]